MLFINKFYEALSSNIYGFFFRFFQKQKIQVEGMEEKTKVTEKEISFLKVQVAKVAKEKEDEKASRINTLNKLHNIVEEKKNMATTYEEKIKQLEEDMRELKNHLVNVTQ